VSPAQRSARCRRFMPGGLPKYVRCYDNNRTVDRYTVVFTGRYRRAKDDEFIHLGMSEHPFHPQGFGQHGSSRDQIDRPRSGHLGRRIKFEDLPADCRQCVRQTYRELWDLNEPDPEGELCPPKV